MDQRRARNDQPHVDAGQHAYRVFLQSPRRPKTLDHGWTGPEPVKIETGETAFNPAVSRDGKRLAYTLSFIDSNLYSMSIDSEQAPTRIVESTREDHSPAISPDGKRIVFVSKRTGTEELYICDLATSRTRQITSLGAPASGSPKWSPDGKTIAFDTRVGSSPDLYLVDADGGTPPRRLTDHSVAEVLPYWSPDGKTIYFNSNRTGRGEIYGMPSSGGEAWQITKTEAFLAVPSPDGKLLYFTKGIFDAGLYTVPVKGGDEKPLEAFAKIIPSRHWGFLKDEIFVVQKVGTTNNVSVYSPLSGRFRVIARYDGSYINDVGGIDFTADGRTMIFARTDQRINDLMMLEHLQ